MESPLQSEHAQTLGEAVDGIQHADRGSANYVAAWIASDGNVSIEYRGDVVALAKIAQTIIAAIEAEQGFESRARDAAWSEATRSLRRILL
jgi:hypothetical protein